MDYFEHHGVGEGHPVSLLLLLAARVVTSRRQEDVALGEGRVGDLQRFTVAGQLLAVFTGKHFVFDGTQDLRCFADDKNIQESRLPIYQVWPFPGHFRR